MTPEQPPPQDPALDCYGHYSRDNNNCRGCAVAVECYEEREKGK